MKTILPKSLAIIILSVCFIFSVAGKGNQQQVLKPETSVKDSIEQIVKTAIKKNYLPSLSIAVSKDGKIIFQEAYGFSDIENNVPASVNSVYRIGSGSKTMTASIIMALYEKGLLNLDDPIQKYAPSFPEKKAPITVRQLLCHQSGIRNYSNDHYTDEYYSVKRYSSSCDATSVFKNDTLIALPGSKYSYTTYGYVVLGCIIENVTGLTYEQALQKYVLSPSKMTQTTLDYPEKIIPFRVKPYEKDNNGSPRNAKPVDLSNKFPGGGILSTSVDLVRFGNALLNSTTLQKPTTNLMWTRQPINNGEITGYGLGWNISSDNNEIFHGGASAGGTAFLYILKNEKIVISFLTNSEGWGEQRNKLAKDIANVLLLK